MLLVGPPLALGAFGLALTWLEFLGTGMCHSEPPDIPARPCTLSEFMDHGSWSVFWLYIGVPWLPAGLLLCLARWTLTKRWRSRPARAAMWILAALSVAAGALALTAWCQLASPFLNGGVMFVGIAALWTWSVGVELFASGVVSPRMMHRRDRAASIAALVVLAGALGHLAYNYVLVSSQYLRIVFPL